MALAKLCPSLLTLLKSSIGMLWAVLEWGSYVSESALRCSLNLLLKVMADCPVNSSSQSNLLHLYQNITLLLCVIASLSLGATKMFFNILPLLKYICKPFVCIYIFMLNTEMFCSILCLDLYMFKPCKDVKQSYAVYRYMLHADKK